MHLITGSTGHIGKELIKYFEREKIVYQTINKAECFNIKDQKNFQNHENINASSIIHLAAANNHKNFSYDEYYDVNVNLTIKLFEYAESMSIKKFIFFSSIHCQNKSSIDDGYAKTKKIAEEKLRRLAGNSSVEVFILRLPPVINKNTRGNLKLIYNYLKLGFPLILPDIAKNNKRSVIYMNNIATLLQRILDNNYEGNTYMVSRKNDMSTYELMLKIKKDIGSGSFIITLPTIFFKPLEL